jgi:protein-L-isoaspartate(D-aspartate) O-methyltransferase
MTQDLSRRALITSATAAAVAGPASAKAAKAWTRDAYIDAMAASGRPVKITQAQFDAIQARKISAIEHIRQYLAGRFGAADPKVVSAFEQVPREYYHYNYAHRVPSPFVAYEERPKPWELGFGSVLSDYLGQAYMTQVAKPQPGDVTLEIGTGSGFQSSLLSRIAARSYSIEIIEPIGRSVGKIFAPLGYSNISTRVGDGFYGWTEVKDGFDIIMVTCVAQYVPPPLLHQLKPGGRLIVPIGQPFRRGQVLYVYTKDAAGKVHSRRDMGVYFIPMTGAMMKAKKPGAA